MHLKTKRILGVLILILLGLLSLFIIYTSIYYKASEEALVLLEEPMVFQHEDYIQLGEGDLQVVFYPGAKVDYRAYLPLLMPLQQQLDASIYLVEMPFNLAIFGKDLAEDFTGHGPLVLMGHSLGGAMASRYASDYPEKVSSVILLGAYPYGAFPLDKTLTVVGSLDGALEKIDYQDNLVIIEGGNHAQVGAYGAQRGDAEATITAAEQRQQTIRAIRDFLKP